MKFTVLLASLGLLLPTTSCGVPQYPPSHGTSYRAILRGEVREALASYEAQAEEAEKNAAASWFPQYDWGTASAAYVQASVLAQRSGQLQKGVTYAEKALQFAEKTKEPVHQVMAIQILLRAYNAVRNFEKARELIDRGLTIVNANPQIGYRGVFYLLLGEDLMRRGEYEDAVNAFSLSFDGSPIRTQEMKAFHILRINYLGNAYRRAGKLQEALEQYQRAFNLINEWGLKYAYEGSLFRSMGEIYHQQKDFPQALENFRRALALAESQQDPSTIRSASTRIGDVLRQLGEPNEAIPHYQKAIQQIESTRSLLQSEEYRQSYFEGSLSAYSSMVDVLLSAGKAEDAFNYSERARSRVFLDVLGSKVQLSRVKSGLFEEERALQERIAAIKARLSSEEDGQTNRVALMKELEEAERVYNAFLAKVRKQDKEQASLMAVEPLTLKEVQELLDPGTTLIEYFVVEREVFVWAVEKDTFHFQKVELAKDKLGGLVKTLRDSIFALGERDKFSEVSGSLYKQLFDPLRPHITGKELIIVPHDVLHYLPFHALVASDGRYLIEKYPIYYLSSASLLQFVKEKRRASGDLSAVLAQAGKVLAFGNPDLGDPEKNLEFAELETQELKAAYPGSSVYLRKEATEEKSKSLSPNHDILHFATHAQLNEDDPLSSAVLLAKEGKEDGRLEVREIFGMDLKASLVVLSGCETGLGKLSTGDELVGLTRAFIYAGTPSVVASLWKVDDSSTAALMANFYKNLKTMSKVEALRQAQLQLIRGNVNSDLLARRGIGGVGKLGETPISAPATENSQPDAGSVSTSHPYFWAPFILVGDGK